MRHGDFGLRSRTGFRLFDAKKEIGAVGNGCCRTVTLLNNQLIGSIPPLDTDALRLQAVDSERAFL
jgi:hypothetical protein